MTSWKNARLTKKNNFSYANGLTKADCKSFSTQHWHVVSTWEITEKFLDQLPWKAFFFFIIKMLKKNLINLAQCSILHLCLVTSSVQFLSEELPIPELSTLRPFLWGAQHPKTPIFFAKSWKALSCNFMFQSQYIGGKKLIQIKVWFVEESFWQVVD